MISSHQLKNNFAYQHNYCSGHYFFHCSLKLFIHEFYRYIKMWDLDTNFTQLISIIFDFISTCIPVMRVVTGNFINGKLKLNRFFSPHLLENTVTKN